MVWWRKGLDFGGDRKRRKKNIKKLGEKKKRTNVFNSEFFIYYIYIYILSWKIIFIIILRRII